MRSVITGVAGFIGSHLAEKLLASGHEVVGVDKFLDNYARQFKDSNLSPLANHPSFRFINDDLANIELSQLLNGTDYVFHLAAQPGVRSSWGAGVFSVFAQQHTGDSAFVGGVQAR